MITNTQWHSSLHQRSQTGRTAACWITLLFTLSEVASPTPSDPYAANAYLKDLTPENGASFGAPGLSADGSLLAVATGRHQALPFEGVQIFRHANGEWHWQQLITASNQGRDSFGPCDISSNLLVVGASEEDSQATGVNGDEADDSARGAGAAYLFELSAGTWQQSAYLKPSNTRAGAVFGWAVGAQGDRIVVSSIGESSSANSVNGNQADISAPGAGAVYVFVRVGSSWAQEAYLKPTNPGTLDRFGWSVAMTADRVFVGAPFEDGPGGGINPVNQGDGLLDAGAVYVFVRNGSTWTQEAYIKASNVGMRDEFGTSLAADGNTLIVGAPRERSNATGVNGPQNNDLAALSGAAYVFVRGVSGWTQQAYLKASNTGANDAFGFSVDLLGNLALVGAWNERTLDTGVDPPSNELAPESGAAYLFRRTGTSWAQQAFLKATNTGPQDGFGVRVTISSEFLAVSAPGEDSGSPGINGDQSDKSVSSSGAVYTYRSCGAPAGRPFCFGDGGDQLGCTACPCGNNAPLGSGGGCLNTVSTSGRLSATGATSGNRSECQLAFRLDGAVPTSFAILISGAGAHPLNPANPCFTQNPESGITSLALDGLRCVGGTGTVFRHGVRATDATGSVGTTNGAWLGTVIEGQLPPPSAPTAGQTRYFQSFYRDLPTVSCANGVQTSNGLAVTL